MPIKPMQNEKGIGLVETILALGIAVIVVTALVSLAVFTLRSSQQSKFLLEGSKLASQQVEILRLNKDNSATWETFRSAVVVCVSGVTKCSANLATVTQLPEKVTLSNGTEVDRFFYAENPSSNIVRITSIVEWKSGPTTKRTTVITDITNWRGK